MSDTTLNQFLSRGTSVQRIAYTPVPPTPAAGPSSGYFWFETDTGDSYSWTGAAWQKLNTGSGGSSGATSAIGMMLDSDTHYDDWVGSLGGTKAIVQTDLVGAVVTLVDGATPALDASLGFMFTLAAGGDRTIAVPTNPTNGQKIVIRHLASGGARTLALNSGAGGFRFGSDITSLTATASGKTDYIGCIYSSIDSKWDVIAVTKGF